MQTPLGPPLVEAEERDDEDHSRQPFKWGDVFAIMLADGIYALGCTRRQPTRIIALQFAGAAQHLHAALAKRL